MTIPEISDASFFDFSTLLLDTDVVEARETGEMIFEMGQPGQRMYVVTAGQVQIKLADMVYDSVEKGGIIGEMALLDDDVRSASAFAGENCRLVAVDKKRLLDWIQEQPRIAIEIAKIMVRRLRTMNFLAHHDKLTQLPNRNLFQERCRVAVMRARQLESTLGVLFIDLDHFKSINESLGYAFADLLLRQVANRLRGRMYELDTLARMGADEFAVLLDVESSRDLAGVASNILELFSKPFVLGGQEIYISASIGISCYPQDCEDAESLLKNADTAMHSAKTRGRNCSYFYAADMNAIALETLTLKNHLRQALDRQEFHLNYQPRVDLESGRIEGVEALIRWQHPERGFVTPAAFIPLAEQMGLIDRIGEWVLMTACKQHKAWLDSGLPPFRMAVNLSARQLRLPDLKQRVAAILAETGLDATYLELEVTESVFMENAVSASAMLSELRAMGIAIAMDDFGTGYSSLGYLKQFPLDFLKIDQSFVRGIPGSVNDMAIVRTIITLAKTLGLKVIAEGVEAIEQIAFLKLHGCEQYQGYHFSRPLMAKEIGVLLRKNLLG